MKISVSNTSSVMTIVVAVLVAGCSSVTIKQPLSADPKPVDKEKFEGTWLAGSSTLTVRFAKDGVGRIAGTRWEDDSFRLARGEMIVTEGRKHNFVSVRMEDEDGTMPDGYGFLQYTFVNDNDLVLWGPNVEAFEEAIQQKALQGDITKSQTTSVTVTSTPKEILAFIDDPERTDLFKYSEPVVLRKVAPADKEEQEADDGE